MLNITNPKELMKGQEKKVYLIKDECHIATNNLDSLTEKFFTKTYNFSATPKLSRGQSPDVEIKNDDAVNAKLIKDIELNKNDGGEEDDNLPVSYAIKNLSKSKKIIGICLV